MKLKVEDIRGQKFDIEVDSQGQFFCSVDGDVVKAHSLELLRKKLMAMQKRKHANIAIPFAYYEHDNWSDKPGMIHKAVAVGIHAANDNVLVKIDGEESSQQWSRHGSYECVPVERAEELEQLYKAVEKAEKALERFTDKHKFSIRDAVKKAMGEEEKES